MTLDWHVFQKATRKPMQLLKCQRSVNMGFPSRIRVCEIWPLCTYTKLAAGGERPFLWLMINIRDESQDRHLRFLMVPEGQTSSTHIIDIDTQYILVCIKINHFSRGQTSAKLIFRNPQYALSLSLYRVWQTKNIVLGAAPG